MKDLNNVQTEVNTLLDESFKSQCTMKSMMTIQPINTVTQNNYVTYPKRVTVLGIQSNYNIKDNLTGKNVKQPIIEVTNASQYSNDKYNTLQNNNLNASCSTYSGRQRVRVKINANKEQTKYVNTSFINNNSTPQCKVLNTQIFSKNLAITSITQQVSMQPSKQQSSQSIVFSKTPSAKLMDFDGDEPLQERSEVKPEQSYTSLLMQHPSTKNLLDKINQKHKELLNLPSQQKQPEQQKIEPIQHIANPRHSLPLKLLTLPKKSQVEAVKIDLGDSPNINDDTISQQKPTTLTNIGNKTFVVPRSFIKNTQNLSNHYNTADSSGPSLMVNIDNNLSHADNDELRLNQQKIPTLQPSRQQYNGINSGLQYNYNSSDHQYLKIHHQLGGSLETKNLQSLINGDNDEVQQQQTQLQKYGDRTQNLSKKNLLKSESKKLISIEYEENQQEIKKENIDEFNYQSNRQVQRVETQESQDQSIAQIQIEKVNEEYCLNQTRANHSKKNTIFCQGSIIQDALKSNNNTIINSQQNQPSIVDSPYQIQNATPNAQQNKKKALVRKFKYKNFTENQTPSSKSFLTDNQTNNNNNNDNSHTPHSNNTSVCGMSQYSVSNTKFPQRYSILDTQLYQQNGTQSTRNKHQIYQGNLYAPSFIKQDYSASPDGHRKKHREHHDNDSSGNSKKSGGGRLLRNNNQPIVVGQIQQQLNSQYYQQQQPHQQKAYKDNASTSSQQDIQNRIAEVKHRLLTKTQIFRVDENRRISLPLQKNSTQTFKSNNNNQYGNDMKSGMASADISDAGSIMQEHNNNNNTKMNINYVKFQNHLNSQLADYSKNNNNNDNIIQNNIQFHKAQTQTKQLEEIIDNANFTGFQPNNTTGGGTFSADQNNLQTFENNGSSDNYRYERMLNKQKSKSDMRLQNINESLISQYNKHDRKDSTMTNVAMQQAKQEEQIIHYSGNSFDQQQQQQQFISNNSSHSNNNVHTNENHTHSNQSDDEDEEVDHNNVIEQEEKLAASLPMIKGTLYKKIDNPRKIKGGKSYKKRYGLVRNKKFKYYKDKEMKELGGVFDFDRIQCVIMIDDGSLSNFQSMTDDNDSPSGENRKLTRQNSRYIEPKKFRIEVVGSKRNFLFHVQSSSALRQWTQALYANWHASRSYTLNNSQKILNSVFWKTDVITIHDFRKLADTGDILLFTGSSFVTRVQRAITMSEYDHVAMLLRYSNGKLVMFESTGQTGVAVLDWDLFVKNNWNKLYTKLCFRKLRHNRTLETMQKLETFIRSVIGSKYKLSTTKIFRKKYENDAENVQESDDKSYFCSELVASAYKCLGLLPKDISASQYWPGNFSSKSGLKLMGDSMLEDEQTILFEE